MRIVSIRKEDVAAAEKEWQAYKYRMRHHPRRQLRKRELVAGFLSGVVAERTRQETYVHPNLMRIQHLLSLAKLRPVEFQIMKDENPEAVARLLELLNGASHD